MPIETNINVSPYFDDYDAENNYQRVIFKPRVAVQTRELNNLQSMLQKQIEIFGTNIFKRGTIIDGCNFTFIDNYPYVKIKDSLIDGSSAIPSNYIGYFIKNSTNLKAKIINSYDGFESADPDLKTLYLNYINSGNSFSESTFTAGEVLTIYDSNNSIHKIDVNTPGTSYSNSDAVIITPQLIANVTSGSFAVGDTITDPITNANGIITAIESLSERLPVVKLPGTISITSDDSDVTGVNTLFTDTFSNGDYIAIYSNNSAYSLYKINVVASNTSMNLTSNASVTNSAASFANTTSSELFIQYKPETAALSNTSLSSNSWTFSVSNTIQGASASDTAKVLALIGQNAGGSILTDSTGQIDRVIISNRGNGYTKTPYATIQSSTGTGGLLTAQNYVGQATAASVLNSTGSGYAFSVSKGWIFQKGHFIRVNPQTVIVEKYNRYPNNVIAIFETQEDIINSNEDTSLVDNSLGSPNYNAPGADRLRLTANLTTIATNTSSLTGDTYALVEWSNGTPYKQNVKTTYNVIQDVLAEQVAETDGNYVIDKFLVNSASPGNTSLEGNTINIIVDPGTAYIAGRRLQTLGNFVYSAPKATTTNTYENTKLSLNYENYVRVHELGGLFEFDQANEIGLYDTAKNFISTEGEITSGNTNPSGTQIGTARIRNFTHEQGIPGSPNAIYRLYLFDIKMNAGKNFADVRAIYYNGSGSDGIADAYLENNPTTGSNNAVLYGKNNSLLFKTGHTSIKNSNNISYNYRTIETASISNTGTLQKSLVSISKTFPYTGSLTDTQKSEIFLAPKANIIAFDTLTGTADVSAGNTTVSGTGTSFISEIKVGDYIYFSADDGTDIKRVTSIANNTSLTVDANVASTNTVVSMSKAWPQNVPIQLAYNTNYTTNVNSTSEILTIDLLTNSSNGFNTSSNTDVYIGYNVESNNASATNKTVNRNVYVKLQLSNNTGTSIGPWCLGVPDIFRLKGVWKGNSSSVSETDTNVTNEFYIDHNQTPNFYDLGYLYQRTNSNLTLTDDDFLLVKFDCFTAAAGFYNITSYVSSNTSERTSEDSKAVSDLTDSINTLEIPELFTDDGTYYDLADCVDFRPYVSNTATITAVASSATLNPANTFTFSSSNRFFPIPDSIMTQDIERYVGRSDAITVDKSGKIVITEGVDSTGSISSVPRDQILINVVGMPPYPAVPYNKSNQLKDILDTKMVNQAWLFGRSKTHEVVTLINDNEMVRLQPSNYTQEDIGNIERRVEALEYYVTLNRLQTGIKDRVIPSSISPTIDRFKYGFFVDDFDTSNYTEYRSPEYSAQVSETHIEPPDLTVNLLHSNSDSAAASYTNYALIEQNIATKDDGDACSCNTSSNSSSNTVLLQLYAKQENKNDRGRTSKLISEPPQFVTMGTSSSNATLWFHIYSGKDKIYIYQGNTTVQDTLVYSGDDAEVLTQDEVNELKTDSFFSGSPDGYNIRVKTGDGSVGDGYVRNSGKISWTHNPSLGRTYRIEVKKASLVWRYRLDYYNNDSGNVCTCDPINPPAAVYEGVMSIDPPYFKNNKCVIDIKNNNTTVRDNAYKKIQWVDTTGDGIANKQIGVSYDSVGRAQNSSFYGKPVSQKGESTIASPGEYILSRSYSIVR